MVFYRTYRPQKIEELDNPEIREKLYSVFSKGLSVHAFLFTGPKGLGKTSAARIIAKVINCEKKLSSNNSALTTNVEPCNKCYQCTSITDGTNMDVLEIDAASNRGIDEIRDLREKVRLAPFKASKKVYIIDEVHMLTTEAFNALLKTLEEPPEHVVFILCTTESQKIPATIISRCFHISFNLAKEEELLRSFTRIMKKEGLTLDKEALSFIASLSDGSFRDGSKILEELALTYSGQKITKEMIEKKYQMSGIRQQVIEILTFMSVRNTRDGLKLVSSLVGRGVDMKYFAEQMINQLHLLLLSKLGVEQEADKNIPDLKFTVEEIKKLVELLAKAYADIKYTVISQLPLEIAIIEWCEPVTQVEITSESAVQASRGPAPTFPPAFAKASAGRPASAVYPSKLEERSGVGNPFSRVTPQEEKDVKEKIPAKPSTNADKRDLFNNEIDIWHELLIGIKPHNHSVAGVLRGCSLKSFDGEKLIIEANYKFHKERLEEAKTRSLIEKVVGEITKKQIFVEVLLKKK